MGNFKFLFDDDIDYKMDFQKVQQCPDYNHHPYSDGRIDTLQQVQCDKCAYVCDQATLAEHEANAHPIYVYVKEEPQTEILDLDSQKIFYQLQGGEGNVWLEQRNYKEENGSRPPPNLEVPDLEQPQAMQLPSPQLQEYIGISGGGVTLKMNAAKRPKTFNCGACNRWFTSSGHLKRHYDTKVHKNSVEKIGVMDPAYMAISSDHQPPSHEKEFQFQPQQEPQKEHQDIYQFPNGMTPQTTNFIIDPLPSFNELQSLLIGYSCGTAVDEKPTVRGNLGGSVATSRSVLYECVECDKTFNKACYLTQHNKSNHSGDKPYKCQRCGKRFQDEYLHQEHLQKHVGEKPHKCQQCPKQFVNKSDLRRHMRLHTGKMAFCTYCNKGFIRRDHMVKHVVKHIKKIESDLNRLQGNQGGVKI